MMGEWGGVWGDGVSTAVPGQLPLDCSTSSRPLPHHIPLLPRDCAYHPPSHLSGGGALGREGGMVGLMDG